MDVTGLAKVFKALSDPTRVKILELLCRCCGSNDSKAGLTVSEVCCGVGGEKKISSTMSHHIKELRNSGLIVTEKQGKHVICRADQKKVKAVFTQINKTLHVTKKEGKLP